MANSLECKPLTALPWAVWFAQVNCGMKIAAVLASLSPAFMAGISSLCSAKHFQMQNDPPN